VAVPHKKKTVGGNGTDAAVAAKFSVLLDLVMTVNAIEKRLVKAIIAHSLAIGFRMAERTNIEMTGKSGARILLIVLTVPAMVELR
jgi:hypothetical protein